MTKPTPEFKWTDHDLGWFAIWGKYRLEVDRPYRGGFLYPWRLKVSGETVGNGGTPSAQQSKRAAIAEFERVRL